MPRKPKKGPFLPSDTLPSDPPLADEATERTRLDEMLADEDQAPAAQKRADEATERLRLDEMLSSEDLAPAGEISKSDVDPHGVLAEAGVGIDSADELPPMSPRDQPGTLRAPLERKDERKDEQEDEQEDEQIFEIGVSAVTFLEEQEEQEEHPQMTLNEDLHEVGEGDVVQELPNASGLMESLKRKDLIEINPSSPELVARSEDDTLKQTRPGAPTRSGRPRPPAPPDPEMATSEQHARGLFTVATETDISGEELSSEFTGEISVEIGPEISSELRGEHPEQRIAPADRGDVDSLDVTLDDDDIIDDDIIDDDIIDDDIIDDDIIDDDIIDDDSVDDDSVDDAIEDAIKNVDLAGATINDNDIAPIARIPASPASPASCASTTALTDTVSDVAQDEPGVSSDGRPWEEHVADLEREIKTARDDAQRIALLQRLATMHWEKLDDREQAARLFQLVLELDPTHDGSFEALCLIYKLEWDSEKLIDLMISRTALVESADEQSMLLQQVAELYEKLNQPDKAIIALEAALKSDPTSSEAHNNLERLRESHPPTPPAEPIPEDPLEYLEYQLNKTHELSGRIEIHEQIAALGQRQENIELAIDHLEQAITLNPQRQSSHEKLEQLFRQLGRHADQAKTLRRLMEVITPRDRRQVGLRLAELYEGPLDDPRRAIETYQVVLSIDREHLPSLRALASLYEQLADWPSAAEALQQLADATDNVTERGEILFQLGSIRQQRLGDASGAEACYQMVLQGTPDHVKSIVHLAQMYKKRKDWGKTVKLMLQAERHSTNPSEKARYLFAAGMGALEGLGNEDRAQQLLEHTLELDPDHAQAALPLSTIYLKQKRYEEAQPVLDVLLRKTDRNDHQQLLQIYYNLGVVNNALDKPDLARKFLEHTLELDPDHRPALLELAGLSYRTGDWSAAGKYYRRLLGDASLEGNARVTALYNLGISYKELGQQDRAVACLKQALELAPTHQDALKAQVQLLIDSKSWRAALAAMYSLLDSADADDALSLELYRQVGDIHWQQMRSAEDGEAAYLDALRIKPGCHVTLHKLIDLYSETKQWQKTIAMCERMAELEPQPELRAKYYATIARIYRDQLDDVDHAIKFFNRVLDQNPEQLKAFEAIDTLLTKHRRWKQLEQSYAKMIARLPSEGMVELKVLLWTNLGEVLRSRRRDFEAAIAAYEAADRLDPDNPARQKILSELYVNSGPRYLQKAITAHHDMLRRNPRQFTPYKVLRKLYMDGQRYDRAWCFCQALTFLKQADEDELGFYRQYRQQRVIQVKRFMNDEIWRTLVHHPDQHPVISAIFATVTPMIASLTVRPLEDYGLGRKELRDPQDTRRPLFVAIDYASQVLRVIRPNLYLQPDKPQGLLMAHTPDTPSFAAGSYVLGNRSEKELMFIVAKQLSCLRPEHFLRYALPSRAQLQAVLLAIFALFKPDLKIPESHASASMPVIERLRQHMQPALAEALQRLLQRFSLADVAKVDHWWNAMDLTSDRVGFILCNDLETAAAMISADPRSSELPPKERLGQLIQYASSETYLKLRDRLGLTIDHG